MGNITWISVITLNSKSYLCGYCGKALASERGWSGEIGGKSGAATVYICHFCSKPTYFDESGEQSPSAKYGENIGGIDEKSVELLYDEARKCFGCGSYTACVLCCRKLLMNIAVSKGAKENLKFIQYVEFLSDNSFIPPDAKGWVDHIREKGNEATHEIAIMAQTTAEDLLSFSGMLLKIVYEFPANVKRALKPSST